MQIASPRPARARTPFFGRARELDLVTKELERGGGLLTLTGPSGIGKTRLAQLLRSELFDSYQGAGGAWFCSLADIRTSSDVSAAVARSLDIPVGEAREVAARIAGRGRMLLILDNLDAVAAEVGELFDTWLDRCPELWILTTSITPIDVEGVVRFELGPLDQASAIELYLDRAHRAWAGNTFTELDHPAVEELVGRLDRIPLAIELAAARVRVLPPRALLDRFSDRFELLQSPGSTGRHSSLIQALTLTWELLSKQEQTILARASVFEGGFSYDAAVKVLAEDADPVETLDLLDGLRSKSLLQLDESTHEPRFLLYESVADFAARALVAAGEAATVARRHTDYFIEKGETAIAVIESPHGKESSRWLQAERANLIAAHSRNLEEDPTSTARISIILYNLMRGEFFTAPGPQLLEQGVEAARRCGDPLLLCRTLFAWAAACSHVGDLERGKVDAEEALAIAQGIGHTREVIRLLILLGQIYQRLGELTRSAALLDEAIESASEHELPRLEAFALMSRGAVAYARYELDETEQFYSRGMRILRDFHDPVGDLEHPLWIAVVWANQGRFQEARAAFLDSLKASRRAGSKNTEANVLLNLGALELSVGDLDRAERYSLEALSLNRELGARRNEGAIFANLGTIALHREQIELADEQLGRSLQIFQDSGDRRSHAAVLPFKAVSESRLGRHRQARKLLQLARSYFEEVESRASLEMSNLIEGCLNLAEARHLRKLDQGGKNTIARLVRGAEAKLERYCRVDGAELSGALFEVHRLLEEDMQRWHKEQEVPLEEIRAEGIVIGPGASWVETPGRDRIDLRRRLAVRRMLQALVEKRKSAPGAEVDTHELFTIGWPDIKLEPEPAARRVYLGIWRLRGFGLEGALLNRNGGYLLDPVVPISVQGG